MKIAQCHTDLVMQPAAVKGKTYEVVRDNLRELVIRNEQGDIHNFSKDPTSEAYFGNWFKLEGEA